MRIARSGPSLGFMSRLATELTRVKPISFTDQLPLGKSQIPNTGINSVGKPGRRSPGQADQEQVRAKRSCFFGFGGI